MENLLTSNEAAKLLNVSTKTLSRWRQKGGGPAFMKKGHIIRYRKEILEGFSQYGNDDEIDASTIKIADEMLDMAKVIRSGQAPNLNKVKELLSFAGEIINENVNFMRKMGY